jgi:hypothetical protein
MFHSMDFAEQSVVTSARVRLGLLVAMEPGAVVAGQLASIDVSTLGPEDAVVFVQVVERVEGWLVAQRNAGLVAHPRTTTLLTAILPITKAGRGATCA